MKKVWTVVQKQKYLIFSFLIPIFILLFYFLFYHISYKDLFIADLQEQYSNFFYYLKDVLRGKESLFYSFHKGLGGDMLGTFFYYLSSPLNLLLLWIPRNGIFPFMIVLIICKIGLSGFSMYLFLRKFFQKNNLFLCLFSIMYALMGYTILYYFNIMWLDSIFLFPLVLYGIEKIIKQEKPWFYIFFLWLTILSQYYLAFMVSLMSIFYFIYRLYIEALSKREMKKICITFLLSSILTILLACFVLFPVLDSLRDVYRMPSIIPSLQEGVQSGITFLRSFFLARPQIEQSYDSPNTYFSILGFLLFISYFFNTGIPTREKKATACFTVLLCLGYFVPIINTIWHGFSDPAIFNYRYSFLVILFFCLIACTSFLRCHTISNSFLKTSPFIFVILYSIITWFLKQPISFSVLIFNAFFLFSYSVLLQIIVRYKDKKYIWCLLFVLVLELFLNIKMNFMTNKNYINQYPLYDENAGLCNKFSHLEPYYRIEGMVYSSNENFICKRGKISEFISTNHKEERSFLTRSGFDNGPTYMKNHIENEPVINSILGVKYFYAKEAIPFSTELNIKKRNIGDFYLYENTNALSLGFAFLPHTYTKETGNNPFGYQNSFTDYLTEMSVYQKMEYTQVGKNQYQVKVSSEEPMYLYYHNSYEIDVFINGEKVPIKKKAMDNTGDSKQGIISIPNQYVGEEIRLEIQSVTPFSGDEFFLYQLNLSKYQEMIDVLKEEPLQIKKMEKNQLEGIIQVNQDKTLFLSIPYSPKWKAYIDGKEVTIEKLFDTFVGLKIEKGSHTIEMVYQNSSLLIGFMVSSISLGAVLFYLIYQKKMSNKCIKNERK